MGQKKFKILDVGFPKVGNTWIGRVLSNALNAQFIEYDVDGHILPDSTMDDVLLRISGAIPGREKTTVEKIEKTHLLPGAGKHAWKDRNPELTTKIVYLTRDPRDMAVSYFYFTYHNRPYVETGHVSKCGYLERKRFLLTVMLRYQIHKNLWAPHVNAFISYEEMWNDPHRAVVTLLDTLNVEFDDDRLREAIGYFSWKNLAKGRMPGDAINTSFLRSGVTGSHKTEFDLLDHVLARLAVMLAWCFSVVRRVARNRDPIGPSL